MGVEIRIILVLDVCGMKGMQRQTCFGSRMQAGRETYYMYVERYVLWDDEEEDLLYVWGEACPLGRRGGLKHGKRARACSLWWTIYVGGNQIAASPM